MREARRVANLAAVTAVFLLAGLIAPAAASAAGTTKVLLSDLSSPKGISLNPRGELVVGQGAFGPPAPAFVYIPRGRDHGTTFPISDPANIIDLAATTVGGGWALLEGGDLLHRSDDGSVDTIVANIPDYQKTDPDPYDQEGDPSDSNPYGLAALPNGDALVADAAGNDLLRVTPGGHITTVARWTLEEESTQDVPPEAGPVPPTLTAEAVPTSVTIGPNGWVYVGQLKGFPFRRGSSDVWAVNPNAHGAVCSREAQNANCKIAYSGFTAIQDIYFERQTSTLYVYELAKGGVFAFEAGFDSGNFPPAVLLEVKKNKTTELAKGRLSQPGGVVATNRGHVYVTDGMFSNGRVVEVHR